MTDMRLYQQLAEDIGFEDSKLVPKMFSCLADEEEAKFLLAAAPPATVAEISEKTGLPLDKVNAMVEPLFKKGLIFKSKKPDATRYYRVRNYLQFHDATVLAPGVDQEYLDLWKEFEATERPGYLARFEKADFSPFMRVVPVNVTLEPQNQVMAFEDVKKMVAEATTIAVTNCSCRTIHGITDVPLEVCMQLNRAADYALERGTGRKLTNREAIEMLKMCEEAGLVHCVENKYGLGHVICNCDNVACGNWGHDRAYLKKFTAPSRFKADVDPDLCTACGTCADRCFFDAVSMTGPDDTAIIDPDKCMGCGICVPTCPGDAITYEEVRPLEFIPK